MGLEAVSGSQMATERLRSKPAFEANDMVPLDRASKRNRRPRRILRWRRLTPKSGKRPMHFDNQSCELVGPNPVMLHIAPHDASNPSGIDPRCCVSFRHHVLPDYWSYPL
jgi:hypothetical protein